MKSAGKGTFAVAELIDLFPTLTELCGLKNPKALDGTSLVPVLNDPAKSVKDAAFTQHPRPAYYDRTEKGVPEAMGYSVRTLAGRYTEWRDWETGKLIAAEYYDWRVTAEKPRNFIDELKDTKELKAARAALHAQFPPDVAPAKR
jgi:iduronate 2-sulfatase